ncbi:MAG: cytochrome c maturation protein CcmE [SAR324 cluster bacterium]|nr:cytochrome c maturation protein CcmE [SAR324 cluster bacterium]
MKTTYKFLIGGLIIFAVLAAISFQGIQEMTVFFHTPAEILKTPDEFQDKTIRIGALVQAGSVKWDAKTLELSFNVTEDSQQFIPVSYQGVKPDMFREGQGVVVEGKMQGEIFQAQQLLVKHSEEYKIESKEHQDKKEYYKTLSDS